MKEKLDKHFMRMALKEAAKGLGRTSPNPCVGAVIVKDGRVLGKGYHKKAGTPHAEINALADASASVAGATLYVTLEPCNHTGRTPPCSRAILAAGISRVVVGMTDPNPLVKGGGIEFLRNKHIEVQTGVLQDDCQGMNLPFIKHITQGIPWMIMKAGVSLDGRLNYQSGSSGWITGEQSARAVHKLRNSVDAILVGRRTVEIDNPSLTTRLFRGESKDAIRIILDTDLLSPLEAKVYALDSPAPTWIACATDAPAARKTAFEHIGIRLLLIDRSAHGVDLHSLLKVLGRENICSVLVEGGAAVHGAFLCEKIFDYAHLFYAPLFAGDHGVPLITGYQVPDREAAPRLEELRHKRLGDDIMLSGRLCYRRW